MTAILPSAGTRNSQSHLRPNANTIVASKVLSVAHLLLDLVQQSVRQLLLVVQRDSRELGARQARVALLRPGRSFCLCEAGTTRSGIFSPDLRGPVHQCHSPLQMQDAMLNRASLKAVASTQYGADTTASMNRVLTIASSMVKNAVLLSPFDSDNKLQKLGGTAAQNDKATMRRNEVLDFSA